MTETSGASKRSYGWVVAFAGFGTNLALGVLYSWSVFADSLRSQGWSATHTQIPYMIAAAVFALLMVPAGSLQDRFGPKPMLRISFILTGIAFVLSGLFVSLTGMIISFGILFGTAMGFGYSTTTPTAIKWFGPQRRGLISGIVVSGFGLAGLYVAPLTTYLIRTFSLSTTFIILGIFFSVMMAILHFFIKNPPEGYKPPIHLQKLQKKQMVRKDLKPIEMLTKYQFYLLWIIFFFGTFSGLKVLGQLSSIGKEQAALTAGGASFLVMLYAVFNCAGRFGCGIVSDKIGRKNTVIIIFAIQVITYLLFRQMTNLLTLSIGTALVAICFGGMLALFPPMTADYFGVKNLGTNYGLVFTAWGVGGIMGPLIGGIVRDTAGTYDKTYMIAAITCGMGLVLSFFLKPPKVENGEAEV